MENTNILTLNINSNAFESMKNDFDKVLRSTLCNMQAKQSRDATLTVKVGISLTEAEVPDWDSLDISAMKKILKPRFDHKVSSVMQIKTEESGSLKGEYELMWDEDAQNFVMKPIDNGQSTLFDDSSAYNDAREDATELSALPATEPLALPAPDAVIEADCVEEGYEYEEDDDE